jgi:MerR family Zn(II)-responsive transcriptional regulator of zntA
MMVSVTEKGDQGFRSGQLAKLAGVSPDTIRYYERKGLLPEPIRTRSGYRLYDSHALMRLRMIRSALAVGFTINDLSKIFRIRASGGIPCEEVLRIAQEKLIELDQRMAQLRIARRDLHRCMQAWNKMLAETRKGTPARLLERMKFVQRPSPLSPPGLTKKRRMKNA